MASRFSHGLNKYSVHAETCSPNKPLLQAGMNNSRSGGQFYTANFFFRFVADFFFVLSFLLE